MGQAPPAPTIPPERAGYVAYMIVPPDGGFGWIIIVIAFVGCVILDGITFSFSLFREPIAKSLSIDSTEVALLNSGFTGIYFIGGIVSCAIANRYGFRVVMMVGAVLMVICSIITGVLNYMYQMYIIYGLIGGMGAGLISIALLLPPGFYFDKKRPIAMGLSASGTGVGAICMPPIMEYCVNECGWRNTFFIQGGILGILVLLGFFLRPLEPVQVTLNVNENISDTESIRESFMFTTFPDAFSIRSLTARSVMLPESAADYPTITNIAESTGGNITLEHAPQELISRLQQLTALRSAPSRTARMSVHGQTNLSEIPSTPNVPLRKRLFKKQDSVGARPLYRSDILYHGSLMRLNEYSEKETDIEYHMEVTRPATRRDILQESEKICLLCPEAIWRGLNTLFNCKLLKSPTFLCLSTCALLNYFSFYIPFLYIGERAKYNGMGKYETILISAIGVGLTIGRILSGIIITLFPKFSALSCIIITCSLAGISAVATTCYNHVVYQIACMAVYGFTVGVFAPLRSIVIVDFMGLDQLTTASGMIIFIQGIGSLIGPPGADFLKNEVNDPNAPFYLAGGFLLMSAIVIMPMKLIHNWEMKRERIGSGESYV